MDNYGQWSDRRLKYESLTRLAQGVLPYNQWACVFANPELAAWPNLQNKAFCVWFPTMIDYVRRVADLGKLHREAIKRALDCNDLFDLMGALHSRYRAILALYSREEQIFLVDRRNQNVHGSLSSINIYGQRVKWFDACMDTIRSEKLSPDDYSAVTTPLHRRMIAAERELRLRIIHSEEVVRLHQLYEERANPRSLCIIGQRLGILGEITDGEGALLAIR